MKIAFEKVISDRDSSFRCREKREQGFKGIHHFHPELELGRPFKALLLEMRVSHACKLLVETDATIIVITQQCGFTNLSNFNRRFKAFSGTTPREYRARMLKP